MSFSALTWWEPWDWSSQVILITLEQTRSVVDFAITRFAQRYPACWLCLAMTTAVKVMFQDRVQSIIAGQIAANVTMANAYLGSPPIESVYWPFAMERRGQRFIRQSFARYRQPVPRTAG